MSIEHDSPNRRLDQRGEVVPPEQQTEAEPDWPTAQQGDLEIPVQRVDAPEDYVIPEKGRMSRKRAIIALGTAVAAAAAIFGTVIGISKSDNKSGASNEGPNFNTNPSNSAAPSESYANTAPITSETTVVELPRTTTPEIGADLMKKNEIAIGTKKMSIDDARQSLFTVTTAEAPSPDTAITEYINAIKNGMNMNTNPNIVQYNLGGSEKAKAHSYSAIKEGGLLKNLDPEAGVVAAGAESFNERNLAEMIVIYNGKNVDGDTLSVPTFTANPEYPIRSVGNGKYKVAGFVTVATKTREGAETGQSEKYAISVVMTKGASAWDFSDTVFVKGK